MGMPKVLEHIGAGRKNSVQKPTTFSEANQMICYTVLFHFVSCCGLCVKSAPQVPKIEGGFSQTKVNQVKAPTLCIPMLLLI